MDQKLITLKEQQAEIFVTMADMLAALASPVRIKLIHLLSQGPLTVEVLSQKIDQSVANTSMHLRKMLAAKVVTVSVIGRNRLYALHEAVFEFWEYCQNFAQQVNPGLELDVVNLFGEINWNKDLEETTALIQSDAVTLIDVRPEDEVSEDLGAFPVVSIPCFELEKHLATLPKDRPLLVFCRGRWCALSAYAVNLMREQGLQAYRLNQSWFSLKKVS